MFKKIIKQVGTYLNQNIIIIMIFSLNSKIIKTRLLFFYHNVAIIFFGVSKLALERKLRKDIGTRTQVIAKIKKKQ